MEENPRGGGGNVSGNRTSLLVMICNQSAFDSICFAHHGIPSPRQLVLSICQRKCSLTNCIPCSTYLNSSRNAVYLIVGLVQIICCAESVLKLLAEVAQSLRPGEGAEEKREQDQISPFGIRQVNHHISWVEHGKIGATRRFIIVFSLLLALGVGRKMGTYLLCMGQWVDGE